MSKFAKIFNFSLSSSFDSLLYCIKMTEIDSLSIDSDFGYKFSSRTKTNAYNTSGIVFTKFGVPNVLRGSRCSQTRSLHPHYAHNIHVMST